MRSQSFRMPSRRVLVSAAAVAAIVIGGFVHTHGRDGGIALAGTPISSLTPTETPTPFSPTPTASPGPTASPTATPSTVPPPTVDAGYPSTTNAPAVLISGTKAGGMGVWINGAAAIAVGASTTWSYELSLAIGTNTFAFTARNAGGDESGPVTISITRTVGGVFLTLNPPQSPTRAATTVLSGRKSADAVLLVDGTEQAREGSEEWSILVPLFEGLTQYTLVARNASAQSDPVLARIVRDSLPPTAPTGVGSTPARDSCKPSGDVEVHWNPSTDSGTGVAGYRYRWDGAPEGAADGGATTTATAITVQLQPGHWYLHLAAYDFVDNVSAVRDYGPICVVQGTATPTASPTASPIAQVTGCVTTPNSPLVSGINAVVIQGSCSVSTGAAAIAGQAGRPVSVVWLLTAGSWVYFLPHLPLIDGGLRDFPGPVVSVIVVLA